MGSKRKNNRSRKGGFFFNKYQKVNPTNSANSNSISQPISLETCNIGNLDKLSSGPDARNNLHAEYQKCCPKDFMGRKNTSLYCKKLDTTFRNVTASNRMVEGEYNPELTPEQKQEEMNKSFLPDNFQPAKKKPWYQFWGGKTRKHKKNSKRHRKHRKSYRKRK